MVQRWAQMLLLSGSLAVGAFGCAADEVSVGSTETDFENETLSEDALSSFSPRVVDPGKVYRGRMLTRDSEAKELKALGIKTVIDLREPLQQLYGIVTNKCLSCRSNEEKEILNDVGITHIQANIVPKSLFGSVNSEEVEKVMAILSEPKNYPIYVHCVQGEDRTGFISGLYRVEKQEWEAQKAYDEMIDLGFRTWLYGRNMGKFFKKRTGLD